MVHQYAHRLNDSPHAHVRVAWGLAKWKPWPSSPSVKSSSVPFDVELALEVHHDAQVADGRNLVLLLDRRIPAELVGQARAAARYHGDAQQVLSDVGAIGLGDAHQLVEGAGRNRDIHGAESDAERAFATRRGRGGFG